MRYAKLFTSRGMTGDWKVVLNLGIHKPPYNLGAGYKGGCTVYVAWKCVDMQSLYVPRKNLQFGITRNSNKVPWTRY
jgi:hypothetical protein